jgi:sugar fermentation stimulation protein A
MSEMVRRGHRAVMVFLIQRAEATRLAFARDIDPTYGAAFDTARKAGVEAIALRCSVGIDEIVVDRPVQIVPRWATRAIGAGGPPDRPPA